MLNVFLLVLAITSFITQVGYSVYYSVGIVDISNRVNQTRDTLEKNQIELQQIKGQYFELNSISQISNATSSATQVVSKSIQVE